MISNYEDNENRLKEIIKDRGIVFKRVELSSHIYSDYYYDFKTVLYEREGLTLVGEMMLDHIRRFKPIAKSIGGLEIGSIPLTTTIILAQTGYGKYRGNLTGFTVRKKTKEHGLQKRVEGQPKNPVVIVDDVLTSGRSIYETINGLIEAHFDVVGVVCVMDRQETGTVNILKENGIKYSSLFKHSDFKEYIKNELKKKNSQIN